MQILECLLLAYNAAEPWGSGFGHQASPVFTIILSFLNLSNSLLVQLISMKKTASTCKSLRRASNWCVSYVYWAFTSHQKQTPEYSHIHYLCKHGKGILSLFWPKLRINCPNDYILKSSNTPSASQRRSHKLGLLHSLGPQLRQKATLNGQEGGLKRN